MAGYKKPAPVVVPHKDWYGHCPECSAETKKVTAHVVGGKSRKLPVCAACRTLFPEGTHFTKK